MPPKPPYARSANAAAGGVSAKRLHARRFAANPIKEPEGSQTQLNRAMSPSSLSTKRTQSTPAPAWPNPKKCKTNPISSPYCLMPGAYCLLFTKRTQSQPGQYAKRTQFTRTGTACRAPFYETNPILVPLASRQPKY